MRINKNLREKEKTLREPLIQEKKMKGYGERNSVM
jgi:hypothetical protein